MNTSSLRRSFTEPFGFEVATHNMITQDTFHGWEPDPTSGAAPRSTIDEAAARGKWPWMQLCQPRTVVMKGNRSTIYDDIQKKWAWVPGPGTHDIKRIYEWPKDARHNDLVPQTWVTPISEKHQVASPVDKKVPHKFARSAGFRNQTNLNKIRHTLLPTSHLTPGPGAYTCYSTFGAPSGPTRNRFLGTNGADNRGDERRTDSTRKTLVGEIKNC